MFVFEKLASDQIMIGNYGSEFGGDYLSKTEFLNYLESSLSATNPTCDSLLFVDVPEMTKLEVYTNGWPREPFFMDSDQLIFWFVNENSDEVQLYINGLVLNDTAKMNWVKGDQPCY